MNYLIPSEERMGLWMLVLRISQAVLGNCIVCQKQSFTAVIRPAGKVDPWHGNKILLCEFGKRWRELAQDFEGLMNLVVVEIIPAWHEMGGKVQD